MEQSSVSCRQWLELACTGLSFLAPGSWPTGELKKNDWCCWVVGALKRTRGFTLLGQFEVNSATFSWGPACSVQPLVAKRTPCENYKSLFGAHTGLRVLSPPLSNQFSSIITTTWKEGKWVACFSYQEVWVIHFWWLNRIGGNQKKGVYAQLVGVPTEPVVLLWITLKWPNEDRNIWAAVAVLLLNDADFRAVILTRDSLINESLTWDKHGGTGVQTLLPLFLLPFSQSLDSEVGI